MTVDEINQRLDAANIPRAYVMIGAMTDGFLLYIRPDKPKWLLRMIREALHREFDPVVGVKIEDRPVGKVIAA